MPASATNSYASLPDSSQSDLDLQMRHMDAMQRFEAILSFPYNHLDRPLAIDNPPRRLILASPVVQVTNANLVKDRHLFLFNDILIIAQPGIKDEDTRRMSQSFLDKRYVIKNIVELHKLRSGHGESGGEGMGTARRPPGAPSLYLVGQSSELGSMMS